MILKSYTIMHGVGVFIKPTSLLSDLISFWSMQNSSHKPVVAAHSITYTNNFIRFSCYYKSFKRLTHQPMAVAGQNLSLKLKLLTQS